MRRKCYQIIATALASLYYCREHGTPDSAELWEDKIKRILETAPHGSGIDGDGVMLSDESKPDRLVFHFDFHHLNDVGFYTHWSTYKVIVKPSLAFGYTLRIVGENRNGIKDYFGELFDHWLSEYVS